MNTDNLLIRSLVCLGTALTVTVARPAVDVLNQRFDPPRIYLAAASLNKSGTLFALQGQDNVLRVFVPAVQRDRVTDPSRLSYELVFPAEMDFLPDDRLFPHQAPVEYRIETRAGVTRGIARGTLDAVEVRERCVKTARGLDIALWFHVDRLPAGSRAAVEVTLFHEDQPVFTDRARLHVLAALTPPPPVAPEHFRFYLHYGPLYRAERWDELADILRRVGINAIMVPAGETNRLQAMRARGFYTIAQRAGSYARAVPQLNRLLAEGPAWFEREDGGAMRAAVPHADAVLWDFEPSPVPFVADPETLARFREAAGLDPGLPLNEAYIREKHQAAWIDFRQGQLAEVVRHWADWSRSLRPGIDTILTEGRVNVFNPGAQIDYRRYARHVTICSPMNWNGLNGVHGMRAWKATAPNARFAGCVNLAYSKNSPVFESPMTLQLQIASAALLGNAGTEIYPGQTMDAENFVAFNRVMGFLGRHQETIWEGQAAPPRVRLTPRPKENFEVAIGEGRTLRHIYPDWDRNAVQQTYHHAGGSQYLAALVNWHATEPCYARLQVEGLNGVWALADPEQRLLFTWNGSPALPSSRLEIGCIVKIPPYDFRGFVLFPYNPEAVADYRELALETIEQEQLLNQGSTPQTQATPDAGAIRFAYDDRDGNQQLEHMIVTRAQTVWITPGGHIQRWEAGGAELATDGFGLCRDLLWMPVAERGNPMLDAPMSLDLRQAHSNHAELVLSRAVSLPSQGAMVDFRLTRRFRIADDRPEIEVEAEWHNTSLSMETGSVVLSYRVHHHLRYDGAGETWIDDGKTFAPLGLARNLGIPNLGLTPEESELAGGVRDRHAPVRPVRFGEYFPGRKTLLTFIPRNPATLLQVLRWLGADGMSGTHEWMYRPVEIRAGARWKTAYTIRLQADVDMLGADAVRARTPPAPPPSAPGETLLFHATFDDTTDAAVAAGSDQATLTLPAAFEETPTGRGLRLDGQGVLRYAARDNINLAEGRLLIRFKPQWDGTDTQTRYALQTRLPRGRLSIAKIDDGRLLLTLVDKHDRQHHCWIAAHALFQRGTWYEILCMWNAARGTLAIFLDGRKVAETQHAPWEMDAPVETSPEHGLRIPGRAGIVVDDLKIWGPAG